MERRLSGKVIPSIRGTSDMMEILKKIELMDITNDEKDMLFLVTQTSYKEKESFIRTLDSIIRRGGVYPDRSSIEIIQKKLDAINNKEKQEIIDIAIRLKKQIENNEIVL